MIRAVSRAPMSTATSTEAPRRGPISTTRPRKTLRTLVSPRLRRRERHVPRPHADPELPPRREPEPRHAEDTARHRQFGESIGRVVALHGRVQHRAGGLDPGERVEVEPRHDFGGRSRRRDPAARHDHDGSGEPRYFVNRVADEDDGYADLVAQSLDVVDDLGLAGHVERGQRLVHEQQLRLGHERAAQRHALALAAREGAGPAVQERLQAEQRHDPLQRGITPLPRRKAVPVEQVAAHAEMGEEPPVLKHVADPAALGPQVRSRPPNRRARGLRARSAPPPAARGRLWRRRGWFCRHPKHRTARRRRRPSAPKAASSVKAPRVRRALTVSIIPPAGV